MMLPPGEAVRRCRWCEVRRPSGGRGGGGGRRGPVRPGGGGSDAGRVVAGVGVRARAGGGGASHRRRTGRRWCRWRGMWRGRTRRGWRAGSRGGSPLPVQYADYTLWQREVLGSEDDPGVCCRRSSRIGGRSWRGCRSSWCCRPIGRGRRCSRSGVRRWGSRSRRGCGRRWSGLARAQGATVSWCCSAALAVLLHKLGGGDDIAVGGPVAGRTDEALDGSGGVLRQHLGVAGRCVG